MKGIRFYEEFGDKHNKRRGHSAGNCVAVITGQGYRNWSNGDYCVEGLASIFAQPNGPVATTGVSLDWLSETCKRVSKARARQVHPALFERLNASE